MSVDNWYVGFVAADMKKRREMLMAKNKNELTKIAKYFRVPVTGNTTQLRNALICGKIRLPI